MVRIPFPPPARPSQQQIAVGKSHQIPIISGHLLVACRQEHGGRLGAARPPEVRDTKTVYPSAGNDEPVALIEPDYGVTAVTSPRRDWSGLGRWRHRFRWAGRKLYAAPPAMRIVAIAATILLVFTAINLVYHVLRKPTEMFVLVNG